MAGRTHTTLACLTLILAAGSAQAQTALPEIGPLPFSRPGATPGAAAIDKLTTTGSVSAYTAPRMASDLMATGSVAQLKNGLDALAGGDLREARRVRDGLSKNSLDRQILTWAIAVSGGGDVSSNEIFAATDALTGWPGMATLQANAERALLRENPGPRDVIEKFSDNAPETVQGAILLARANLALGHVAEARAALSPFWRTQRMEASEEQAIIREFGGTLTKADHRFRMERMLYADRIASAERVAGLADARELAKAFAAVTRNEKNAAKLLDAVPAAQRSAAFTFAQARHLRRTEKYRQAAATMLKAPTDAASLVDPDAASLVDPDAWWIERRVLSREMLDIGDPATAYRLAAAHAAESPVHAVDAEFHAGWYAFRGLGDVENGAKHFARIAEIADGPISLSRAHYWLGRTAEAGGPGEARAHFERAASYGTAFYGQLAAAKLGRTTIPTSFPAPSDADRRAFEARQAVQAIRKLEQAGHARRADSLYRALAQELTSTGELAMLANMAERQDNNHFLALRVGKWAAARGLDVGALAHPVGAIPASANISGAGKALAYAIARQESEFNVSARSGAGALGLLQLLPGTAREMARKAGLGYSQGKLTTDAGYNATLGAQYLDEQLARFSGSYVLTFAGYNAGPRRAQQWVERYGDPRGKDIDTIVDWIERIPFHETRGYVQRVMENYQVYKMRLSGRMDIAADLTGGRQR
ncbi:lytic transglycosylase domain-containing protein [Mesorhizobium microcysteis]|uniref:Lytic transglycosylase domain-containing protein n=1 Tax=Neoaquamicrobium microcysteis TaxID=2682781 RepID=A0A5D4GWY4_9HYPH|nr:lytic transglycosylase domain-containing protein [Mesorhizobium microcysteis]TYR32757.1 lytic transglycosylase domain-containing protein [Mesorhizobium microcysteis]